MVHWLGATDADAVVVSSNLVWDITFFFFLIHFFFFSIINENYKVIIITVNYSSYS